MGYWVADRNFQAMAAQTISYKVTNSRKAMAIITAMWAGMTRDRNRLSPTSVTPKLLGKKNTGMVSTVTMVKLPMK